MMLTRGNYPYDIDRLMIFYDQMHNNKPDLSLIENLEIKSLLKELLNKDPTARPSVKEIFLSPLFHDTSSNQSFNSNKSLTETTDLPKGSELRH